MQNQDPANLNGKFVPWDKKRNMPVPIQVTADPANLYVACFSSIDLLRAMLSRAKLRWDSVMEIKNGAEFLKRIPPTSGEHKIKIVIDPRFTSDVWN